MKALCESGLRLHVHKSLHSPGRWMQINATSLVLSLSLSLSRPEIKLFFPNSVIEQLSLNSLLVQCSLFCPVITSPYSDSFYRKSFPGQMRGLQFARSTVSVTLGFFCRKRFRGISRNFLVTQLGCFDASNPSIQDRQNIPGHR